MSGRPPWTRAGATGLFRDYTLVDYATEAYLVLVGLFILLFHGGAVPGWPILLLLHGVALVLVHGLVKWQAAGAGGKAIDFLRHFYPVLLYTGFYRETGMLNQMLVRGYLDPVFIRLERAIFGGQPSLAWMEAWPFWPVSELLYAAYFSYYVMIAGVALALYLRDRRQFFHYVSVISLTFYACYLAYIFLPVIGPRIFFRAVPGFAWPPDLAPLAWGAGYPAAVERGVFFRLMAFIYLHFEAAGAAFPSSHVTVAIGTAYFSWRYLRRVRWLHVQMVILLCCSTIYCRYHYVVDVLGGIALAGVLLPLADWLFWRFVGASRASGFSKSR